MSVEDKLAELNENLDDNIENTQNQIDSLQVQIDDKTLEQDSYVYICNTESTALLEYIVTKGDLVYTMNGTHYSGTPKYFYDDSWTVDDANNDGINNNLSDWQVFDIIEDSNLTYVSDTTFLSDNLGLYSPSDKIHFYNGSASSMEVSAVGTIETVDATGIICTMLFSSTIPSNLSKTLTLVYEYSDHDSDGPNGWDDSTAVVNAIANFDYANDSIHQPIGIATGSYGTKDKISLLNDGKGILQKDKTKLENGRDIFEEYGGG